MNAEGKILPIVLFVMSLALLVAISTVGNS